MSDQNRKTSKKIGNFLNSKDILLTLGPLIGEEVEGIRKVSDLPMAGMFSNAEMARATNRNLEMHAFTVCSVVRKEK